MELSKHYQPAAAEEKWYPHWMEKGYFHSEPDERTPFTIVIPPPNVTGVLHMGHTLNETVQDILIRRARMSGFNACWVPGSDHASIATEAKVVNMLKEQGIDKAQIGRAEFMRYAFEWKEKYGNIIYQQIKRLGCSCDWDRLTFTMDDHYYKAVIKVFTDLYKKGMIYRGARMINWDPAAKTALSDEEVEYREVQSKLYYIRYPLDQVSGAGCQMSGTTQPETAPPPDTGHRTPDTGNYITIATTRPETILGDTAICVNPTDERYTHLQGGYASVPLINRRIPVIFDAYVDKEFGTGCLKVTPAHDINDYNIGLRHKLPVIDVLNEDGTMSEAAQLYVGEDRFAVRKKIVEELRQKGFLVKEEAIVNKNGFSQRTNAVVEPRISTQWFLKMAELAGPALKAVTEGAVKIHPADKFLNTYRYWMENIHDWCISRQLWWGQRIPAWYDDQGNCYVAETEEEAAQQAPGKKLRQDDDVLDTWFSSWLWPMEVFHGITRPGNPDVRYYYPGSVLVTGQDIIFFWVARMIMAGLEYRQEEPFEHVYFTGMVRDKLGRKMSKSLGNSPDLLALIDKFGADAVRFGIMISSPAGNDLLFDEASCEQGRNFCNKLWNAMKLVKMWEVKEDGEETGGTDFAVQWFENRLNEAAMQIEELFGDYRLSEALKILYSLIWDDFCSWYLEWIKPGNGQAVARSVYESSLRFFDLLLQQLHPFMPFVTEDIYHLLRERPAGDDLIVRPLQDLAIPDAAVLASGRLAQAAITAVRDIRNKQQLKFKEPVSLHIASRKQEAYRAFEPILGRQVNAPVIRFTDTAVPGAVAFVVGSDKFFLETEKKADTGAQKEQLLKDLEYQQNFLASVDKKLSNERFVQNAKPEVVENERKKRSDAQARIHAIEESLKSL